MSIIGCDLDLIDRKQQQHILVNKKIFLKRPPRKEGKFCKDFDGFEANYGLTMVFSEKPMKRKFLITIIRQV